jgi:hypothetical protein
MGAYSTDGLTYYLFINQSNLDWAACPEDSTTCGWFSGSTPISKFEHPTLYFIWKATDSNTVEVQCYDGITFQWLASMSFYKDDMGYNSDGIGLQTEREHSLAFIEDTGDLSDGSYMHNSHWYNVYIYNNNVTDQWYSWYTDGTPGPSGTSDEQACVEVISFTRDYEEVVNIDFDLP